MNNLIFRQIRAAHKTNEMSTALRMTEDFSEQQFADIAKEYEAQEAKVQKLKKKQTSKRPTYRNRYFRFSIINKFKY